MSGHFLQQYLDLRMPPMATGLDQDDCGQLLITVRDLAPDWFVEMQTDPLGEVCLMVIPPEVDDDEGPSLVIYKAGLLFHLDQFRWNSYNPIGSYLSLGEVLEQVRLILLTPTRVAS